MREWCLANPTRMKTAKGVVSFVVRWLSQAQDRGGSVKGTARPQMPRPFAKPSVDDLLAKNLEVGQRWLRENSQEAGA